MQGLRSLQRRASLCRPLRQHLAARVPAQQQQQQLRCLASGSSQNKSWSELLTSAADLGRCTRLDA